MAIEVVKVRVYVVVATVMDRVDVANVFGSIIMDLKHLTPCIACITCDFRSRRSIDFGNVALLVLAEVVSGYRLASSQPIETKSELEAIVRNAGEIIMRIEKLIFIGLFSAVEENDIKSSVLSL